ncbi:MAG TPA: VOC family protein [Candidatus Saccharimonadales bacterium]|nr:VOC family protein [Candidatus Saccharimonadales bacterium]
MNKLVPYINFADQGKEAIEFYKSIFGGKADIQLVKDSPAAEGMPKEWGERIFHLFYKSGDIELMGSDVMSNQAGRIVGNVFSLAINCGSAEELQKYFDGLSAGGKVVWPVRDSEWGDVFAQVVDKFGLQWMLNYHGES